MSGRRQILEGKELPSAEQENQNLLGSSTAHFGNYLGQFNMHKKNLVFIGCSIRFKGIIGLVHNNKFLFENTSFSLRVLMDI